MSRVRRLSFSFANASFTLFPGRLAEYLEYRGVNEPTSNNDANQSDAPNQGHVERYVRVGNIGPEFDARDDESTAALVRQVDKRHICRQHYIYNPVSGRCQPSLQVL